jgi:hypothetical protein
MLPEQHLFRHKRDYIIVIEVTRMHLTVFPAA